MDENERPNLTQYLSEIIFRKDWGRYFEVEPIEETNLVRIFYCDPDPSHVEKAIVLTFDEKEYLEGQISKQSVISDCRDYLLKKNRL